MLTFTLNGEKTEVSVPPDMTLLTLLREKLQLMGTKLGCGVGECGACTVILDGEAVNSCLVLAGQIEGRSIITVEGISEDGKPGVLQRSFVNNHAIQCGFCTPGMLMSATALLMRNPNPNEEEIRQALSGNLCRCTGYKPIVKAVAAAAQQL